MIHIASYDLCKELYELSGWDDLPDRKGWQEAGAPIADVPRYDLGYLMRKLPTEVAGNDLQMHRFPRWSFGYYAYDLASLYEEADTPEDAAAQLAIDLFKRGILTWRGKAQHGEKAKHEQTGD